MILDKILTTDEMKEIDYFSIFFVVGAAVMLLATMAVHWWSNRLFKTNRSGIGFGVHALLIVLLTVSIFAYSTYFGFFMDEKFGVVCMDAKSLSCDHIQPTDILTALLFFSLWATECILLLLSWITLLGLRILRRRKVKSYTADA